ncbi:MAG: hypothetical protein P8Y93_14895 [Acidobacteriota bacterium]
MQRFAKGIVVAAVLMTAGAGISSAIDWPQEIEAPEGTIVVYQPQPEEIEGNELSGRAAIAIEHKGSDEPIFGVMWFTARIDTDRDAHTVLVRDVKVTDVRWPDSKDAGEQRFTQIVESSVPASGFEISLEQLTASLATAERERAGLEDIRNDPPEIVFARELAVLLLYDGEPRFSPVEDSPFERVLNTPFLVVRDTRNTWCYLSSGTLWYRAKDPLGPWEPTSSPPQDLVKMLPPPESDQSAPAAPPAIVVATVPTELIVSQGPPEWKTLSGGKVLRRVRRSGRLCQAARSSTSRTPRPRGCASSPPATCTYCCRAAGIGRKPRMGPGHSCRPTSYPGASRRYRPTPPLAVFAPPWPAPRRPRRPCSTRRSRRPPPSSARKQRSRSSTTERPSSKRSRAHRWLTPSIQAPRCSRSTRAFMRSTKACGSPPPRPPVRGRSRIRSPRRRFPKSRPARLYVGYTPGYLWSYPSYGVPVYGTGWYYPPYWGRWYYPRPPTWGFHVGYNPWTGWNFGVSWSNGFFRFGMSWGGGWGGSHYRPWGCCGGGWYGGGYRGPVIINTGNINIGNSVNVGNRATAANRMSRQANLNRTSANTNSYKRPENQARLADRSAVQRDLKTARASRDRSNNVYADVTGTVVRNEGDRWQVRDSGQWKPATDRATGTGDRSARTRDLPQTRPQPSTLPSTRPTTRPTTPQINQSDLNRARSARQTGRSRQMAAPSYSSRPRGGGARRR